MLRCAGGHVEVTNARVTGGARVHSEFLAAIGLKPTATANQARFAGFALHRGVGF
jgi:hypothetical protein